MQHTSTYQRYQDANFLTFYFFAERDPRRRPPLPEGNGPRSLNGGQVLVPRICDAPRPTTVHKFSKVLSVVFSRTKYSGTLTFENLRQILLARVCGFRIQLRPVRRPSGGTFFFLSEESAL